MTLLIHLSSIPNNQLIPFKYRDKVKVMYPLAVCRLVLMVPRMEEEELGGVVNVLMPPECAQMYPLEATYNRDPGRGVENY